MIELVATTFPTAIMFYLILTHFLNIRESKIIKGLVFVITCLVVTPIIFVSDFMNITGFAIAFLLMLLLFFKNRFIEKIAVFLIFYPIIVSLNFISLIAVELWLVNFVSNFTPVDSLYGLYLFTLFIFWLMVYLLLIKKSTINVVKLLDNKSLGLVNIICLASFVSIFSTIFFTKEAWQCTFVSVGCIVTNLGIINLTNRFASSIKLKKESQLLRAEKEYYDELAKNQLGIRRTKHDLNNHIHIISTLITQGEYEKATGYCEQLTSSYVISNHLFCENSVVNAVINAKYSSALQKDIDCHLNLEFPEILPLDEISLCSMIANSFDNAIEACIKLPANKRKIILKARTMKGLFSYSIENSYNGVLLKTDNKIHTSKKDITNHGLGLTIIGDIVEKFNGTMVLSQKEQEFKMTISIVI